MVRVAWVGVFLVLFGCGARSPSVGGTSVGGTSGAAELARNGEEASVTLRFRPPRGSSWTTELEMDMNLGFGEVDMEARTLTTVLRQAGEVREVRSTVVEVRARVEDRVIPAPTRDLGESIEYFDERGRRATPEWGASEATFSALSTPVAVVFPDEPVSPGARWTAPASSPATARIPLGEITWELVSVEGEGPNQTASLRGVTEIGEAGTGPLSGRFELVVVVDVTTGLCLDQTMSMTLGDQGGGMHLTLHAVTRFIE